jgi:hypothetical protein
MIWFSIMSETDVDHGDPPTDDDDRWATIFRYWMHHTEEEVKDV